ncbi:MAG TPA: hypothetical protein PLV45_18580, partial [bacterium]|nr:hypothetical protein [bacterium]
FFRLINIWIRSVKTLAENAQWDAARAEGDAMLAALDRCRSETPAKHLDEQRDRLCGELNEIYGNDPLFDRKRPAE